MCVCMYVCVRARVERARKLSPCLTCLTLCPPPFPLPSPLSPRLAFPLAQMFVTDPPYTKKITELPAILDKLVANDKLELVDGNYVIKPQ